MDRMSAGMRGSTLSGHPESTEATRNVRVDAEGSNGSLEGETSRLRVMDLSASVVFTRERKGEQRVAKDQDVD